MPTAWNEQAPVPPPSYHRAQAQRAGGLHLNALTLIETLHPAFLVPLRRPGGALALSAAFAQRARRFSSHLLRGVFATDCLAQNASSAYPDLGCA